MKTRNEEVLARLRDGLIVSCQAAPGEPLNSPANLAAMARSAVAGGAVGIRANRPENLRAIRKAVRVPIIGLFKREYPDSEVFITATLDEALAVVQTGVEIIALDATWRRRPGGTSLAKLVRELRRRTDTLLMADIATVEEGVAAARLGFDLIGTTLSGYTEESRATSREGLPDLDLITALRKRLPSAVPIVAEGRIATPAQAVEALRRGATSVVVGTAITAPIAITRRYVEAMGRRLRTASAIGVDIGGTKTAVARVAADGTIGDKCVVQSPWDEGATAVAATVEQGIRRILETGTAPVAAIGIGASGRIDPQRGCVFDGVPLARDYFGFPLAKRIQETFGKRVRLENDANAAAYAEHRIGKGTLARRLVCLTIGTGIGGGVVIDGRLLRGRGNAGEFGHMPVVAGGRRCGCGRRGCLERYVSRRLMQVELEALVRRGRLRLPRGHDVIDAGVIMQWIRRGDPAARAVFDRQMDFLAAGLEIIFNTLDPDLLVFSGELFRLGRILTGALEARLARPMRLATSSLPSDAGLVGAALLALDEVT